MSSATRPNPLREFRSARAVLLLCLSVLASCSPPPTLDSVGGVVLEFAIDEIAGTQPPSREELERAVNVLRNRLDPSGKKGVTVRVTDLGRLEVGLPGANANERRRALELVTRLGTLEFAVMANPRDHSSLIRDAQAIPEDKDEVEERGVVVAVWHPAETGQDGKPVDLAAPAFATREVRRNGSEVRQYLVLRDFDDERVTGQYLERVWPGLAEDGNPCINLTFNKEGGQRFLMLTSRNKPSADGHKRQLAIIFDGRIHSAPNVNSAISHDCQVTGNFSSQEIQNLVDVLNAGVLEVPLKSTPVSERVVEPKKADAARK